MEILNNKYSCCSIQINKNTIKSTLGFTIVELLVAMAVFAVAINFAIPNFKAMVSSNRIVSQINNFNGAIAFARSEAIKQGQGVSIVPVDVNNWANGWNIILPGNANQLLGSMDAFNGNTVLDSDNNALVAIQFTDDGRITNPVNIVFTLCNSVVKSDQDRAGKQLTLSATGITYLDSRFSCPLT